MKYINKLNRSRKWKQAKSYKEAREIAIDNGAEVQHKVVK